MSARTINIKWWLIGFTPRISHDFDKIINGSTMIFIWLHEEFCYSYNYLIFHVLLWVILMTMYLSTCISSSSCKHQLGYCSWHSIVCSLMLLPLLLSYRKAPQVVIGHRICAKPHRLWFRTLGSGPFATGHTIWISCLTSCKVLWFLAIIWSSFAVSL